MNKNKYNLNNFKKNGFFVTKKLLTKKDRKLIVSRFCGEGKHTENCINYVLKHREESKNILNDKKNDFFKHLSKNNIYFLLPKKKYYMVYFQI